MRHRQRGYRCRRLQSPGVGYPQEPHRRVLDDPPRARVDNRSTGRGSPTERPRRPLDIDVVMQ